MNYSEINQERRNQTRKDNRLKTEETPNEKIAVLKARRDVLPVRRLPVYSNIKIQLICYCFKWQCVCVCVSVCLRVCVCVCVSQCVTSCKYLSISAWA